MDAKRNLIQKILPLIVVLIFSIWLSGCAESIPVTQPPQEPTEGVVEQPVEQPIDQPYETLAQGYATTADKAEPDVLVASNQDEAQAFSGLLGNQDAADQVQSVDFASNIVVAVSRGEVPNSAEGIKILEISSESDEVRVVVEFTQPGETDVGADVIAYPYQVVSIPIKDIPGSAGKPWAMYDPSGKLLARFQPVIKPAELPFETITMGYSMTANLVDPTLYVANSLEETKDFTLFLDDPAALKQIQSIDYAENWVLAAFRGEVPNSAEWIEILSINPASAEVQVIAEFTQPGEDIMGNDVISYPYHIIAIPKMKLQVPEATPWVMYDPSGKILARFGPEPKPSDQLFETIGQGSSMTAKLVEPALFVANSLEETKDFTQFLDDQAGLKKIQSIDFGANWVVAAFRGEVPTSAEGIEILTVNPESGEVQVIVEYTQPAGDIMGADVISYPYHIISIPKVSLQVPESVPWIMYDQQGTLLAKGEGP